MIRYMLMLITYVTLLLVVYYNYITVYFAGFNRTTSESSVLFIYLAALCSAFFVREKRLKAGEVLAHSYYFMAVIPIALMLVFGYIETYIGIVIVLLGLSLIWLSRFSSGINFNDSKIRTAFTSFAVINTAYVFSFLILSGAILRLNFQFENVYDVRGDYVAAASEINLPFLGYAINWQSNVINYYWIALGVINSNNTLIASGIVMQLLMFTSLGFKSFLFALGIVLILLLVKNIRVHTIGATITLAASIAYLHHLLTQSHELSSFAIRRLIFSPSLIASYYIEYFTHNPVINWSNSILRGVVSNPYSESLTRLISFNYFGRDFSANSGIIGEGYAQSRIAGILASYSVVALLLQQLNRTSKNLRISLAIIFPSFLSFVNSGLFTTLGTHGFLLALIAVLSIGQGHKEKLS